MHQELTFMGILKISLVMPVLLFISILLVMVFLERALFFMRMAKVDPRLFKRIKDAVLEGKLERAQEIAGSGSGLIAQALESLLGAARGKKRADMDNVL